MATIQPQIFHQYRPLITPCLKIGFLSRIDPPGKWINTTIVWLIFRHAEFVPISDINMVGIPLRDDVVIPQKSTVESMGGGNHLLSVFRIDDAINELVYCRVFNACIIAAAFKICRGRSPHLPLLIARRAAL